MHMVNLRIEHVRLLVVTHAHADHFGQAVPIVERASCEVWMNPNLAHARAYTDDPDAALQRRIEVARQSGVPTEPLRAFEERRKSQGSGVAGWVEPDRDAVAGVTFETDHGRWNVLETPGHAPSHISLHHPERRLLLSGDHLLGRVSLYYDYGWTPDPAGEFLDSLDVVDRLDVQLVLAGHGRPVRDARALPEANRRAVRERIERVRRAISDGPRTPYDVVPDLLEAEPGSPMMLNWGLSETLCYLRHLERTGAAHKVDGADPERWALAA